MHKHTHQNSKNNQINQTENKFASWINYFIMLIGTILIVALVYMSLNDQVLLRNLDFTKGKNSSDGISQKYYLAEVVEIKDNKSTTDEAIAGDNVAVDVKITGKKSTGQQVQALTSKSDTNFFDEHGKIKINKGSKVIILETVAGGEAEYNLTDVYRLPAALLAIVAFIILAVIFAGYRGMSSFLGLVSTLMVLVVFIVPQILDGKNPIVISLIGSLIIIFFSLYLAHGFNKRTTLAVASTTISIIFAALISVILVKLTSSFGFGSEEALFLNSGELGDINLKGILLGGIIIGTLGVLDDITTAQTAVVEELRITSPQLKFLNLYKKGISVGKEHISSLVNTLVLAYAGASFPLFILIVSNTQEPLWVILNSEYIIEELVRAVTGSMTLILAVPISTAIAAWWYTRGK